MPSLHHRRTYTGLDRPPQSLATKYHSLQYIMQRAESRDCLYSGGATSGMWLTAHFLQGFSSRTKPFYFREPHYLRTYEFHSAFGGRCTTCKRKLVSLSFFMNSLHVDVYCIKYTGFIPKISEKCRITARNRNSFIETRVY